MKMGENELFVPAPWRATTALPVDDFVTQGVRSQSLYRATMAGAQRWMFGLIDTHALYSCLGCASLLGRFELNGVQPLV